MNLAVAAIVLDKSSLGGSKWLQRLEWSSNMLTNVQNERKIRKDFFFFVGVTMQYGD
jgi:hypothetical protein